jgi:hypothetical protein
MTQSRRQSAQSAPLNLAATGTIALKEIASQCGVLTPDKIVATYLRRGKLTRDATAAPILPDSPRPADEYEGAHEGSSP